MNNIIPIITCFLLVLSSFYGCSLKIPKDGKYINATFKGILEPTSGKSE